MKKFLWLPTMAVAAVLMLNSCELFCEQYAELFCETECPEEITSIMVSLEPFTITGTKTTKADIVVNVNNGVGVIELGEKMIVLESKSANVTIMQATGLGQDNSIKFEKVGGAPLYNKGGQIYAFMGAGNIEMRAGSGYLKPSHTNDIEIIVIIEGEEARFSVDLTAGVVRTGVVDINTLSAIMTNQGACIEMPLSNNSPASINITSVTVITDESAFGPWCIELKGEDIILQPKGELSKSSTFVFKNGGILLSTEGTTIKLPIPVVKESLQAKVSFEYTNGESTFVAFLNRNYQVTRSGATKVPTTNIADLISFKKLSLDAETGEFQVPAPFNAGDSFCFDAKHNGNGDAISPVSVAVISQQAATGLDGTTGNVVENVRLSGGQVTFEAGSPGEAVIGAYDASGNLLASWIIYCGPRPSTN